MPFTIASQVSFEEDIKKSRFQAVAVPVENEQARQGFFRSEQRPHVQRISAGHGKLAIMSALMMMVSLLVLQDGQF